MSAHPTPKLAALVVEGKRKKWRNLPTSGSICALASKNKSIINVVPNTTFMTKKKICTCSRKLKMS